MVTAGLLCPGRNDAAVSSAVLQLSQCELCPPSLGLGHWSTARLRLTSVQTVPGPGIPRPLSPLPSWGGSWRIGEGTPRGGGVWKQAGGLGPCGWPLPGARVGSLRPAFTPEPSGNDFPIFLQPVAWDLSLPSLAGLVFFQRRLTSVLSPTPSGISPAPRSPGRLPAPLRALLCESGTRLVQSGVPRWGAGGQR